MSKKILVVEDNHKQVINLKDIIEKRLQYQAIIAYNGKEGLSKAKNEKPDLIILDIGLPEMDGMKVCEEIRKDNSIKITPIIMLTGINDPRNRETSFELGADDYLLKPYDLKELEQRIKALLRRSEKPPFYPPPDICKIDLSCEDKHPIRVRTQGEYICRTVSKDLLHIDSEILSRESQNIQQSQQWRFYTKETGKRIYQNIFNRHTKINNVYKKSSIKVKKTFKVKLCFESSKEFFRVPVEFLFDDDELHDYLVLNHPISRFLTDVTPQNPPLSTAFFNNLWQNREQLRILLIASNTEPPLPHIDNEILSLQENLIKYLKEKEIPHHIDTITSEKATLDFVKAKLNQCNYHMLHYAGHGDYRERSPERSCIQFWSNENRSGKVERLDANSLNLLLKNSNLRFVYLSCCQSSQCSGNTRLLDDDFPGLTYSIAQAGIPSVLGFRWDVKDESAKNLSLYFYKSLFQQGNLDMALYEARKEIATINRDDQTWISPVLIVQE